MVDPGEHVSSTIRREFQEEAMKGGGEKDSIDQLFSNGYKLFEHYVDDPRNTDNAWIETVAVYVRRKKICILSLKWIGFF